MSRAPRAVPSRLRRKRVFKQAKGFYGRRKNNVTTANAAVDRSMQYAYVGRKLRKRNFRALWIQRINAAVREHGRAGGLQSPGRQVRRRELIPCDARG
jgi:large subunit ribosomal protein L20